VMKHCKVSRTGAASQPEKRKWRLGVSAQCSGSDTAYLALFKWIFLLVALPTSTLIPEGSSFVTVPTPTGVTSDVEWYLRPILRLLAVALSKSNPFDQSRHTRQTKGGFTLHVRQLLG
jgi:hypothetical protein